MPFAYYDRLNAARQRIYRNSDAIERVDLPDLAALRALVPAIETALAAARRADTERACQALVNAVTPAQRRWMMWGVHACMLALSLFMIVYGVQLCQITWNQSMAEFPALRVGLVYAPIPIAGVLTLLFLIERVWVGDPPKTSVMYSDAAAELE